MAADGGATRNSDGAAPRTRARFAKGRRPYFMRDPDVDRLLAVVTALAAESWVMRERLDTAERLAVQGLPATPDNIEAYRPDLEVETARETLRADLLSRVFRILSLTQQDSGAERQYQSLVDEFS